MGAESPGDRAKMFTYWDPSYLVFPWVLIWWAGWHLLKQFKQKVGGTKYCKQNNDLKQLRAITAMAERLPTTLEVSWILISFTRIVEFWSLSQEYSVLRFTWKEIGEVQIKWVKDNIFIIIIPDESSARKILSQVPWAVMKKKNSVRRWP